MSISPVPGEEVAPGPSSVHVSGGGQSPGQLWRQLPQAREAGWGPLHPQHSVWGPQGGPEPQLPRAQAPGWTLAIALNTWLYLHPTQQSCLTVPLCPLPRTWTLGD